MQLVRYCRMEYFIRMWENIKIQQFESDRMIEAWMIEVWMIEYLYRALYCDISKAFQSVPVSPDISKVIWYDLALMPG